MGWTSSFLKFRFLHSFGSKWGEHPICWVRIFHPIAPNDIMRMGHPAKKETRGTLLHLLYHQRFSPSTTSHCHVLNQAKVNIYCIFPRPSLQCLLTANSWFQRDNFGASCKPSAQDDPTEALDSAWWFGEGPALGGTSGRCMALVITHGWDIPERWASKWKNHLWMRGFWGEGNRIYHSKKMETEWTYTVEMGYMILPVYYVRPLLMAIRSEFVGAYLEGCRLTSLSRHEKLELWAMEIC
jgi:hypothetical protein